MPARDSARRSLRTSALHIRSRTAKSPVSGELKEKFKVGAVRPRIGDSVKVMRGEYAGVEGKITKVLPETGRVNLEGVTREKQRGGTASIGIHTSKVMVISLNLDDKWRKERLEARGKGE